MKGFDVSSHNICLFLQVVIKYVPYVGDSKRAMDEYVSELMFGGRNTIAIHNTCEDSLLAAPIIIDLIILGEISERIKFKQGEYLQSSHHFTIFEFKFPFSPNPI